MDGSKTVELEQLLKTLKTMAKGDDRRMIAIVGNRGSRDRRLEGTRASKVEEEPKMSVCG